MNALILELATKAGLYVDVNGKPWPRNMNGEDIEGAYSKFAELIIRECIAVCKKVEVGNSNQMAQLENNPDVDDLLMERYDGIGAGAMICDWSIGHRFGMNDE